MALDVLDESKRSDEAEPAGASAVRTRSETLVVLPTYNESENLASIVRGIIQQGHDVLIIDDNSPDGTGELADQLASGNECIEVAHRPTKLGLGTAYVAGFGFALDHNYDFVVEMDADGSHQIDDLDALIAKAKTASGLAIGSRYVWGGRTSDRAVHRRALTRLANFYCRLILGHTLNDWTSGFRCYSSQALRQAGLDGLISAGFSFQIEMAHRCLEAGIPVLEVPIRFQERTAGRSKASMREITDAFRCVTRLSHRSDATKSAALLENGRDTTAPPSNTPSSDGRLTPNASSHPLTSAVVGVLAHNEEATIETCLKAILDEPLVQSVVVVASGCTDRTEEIANQLAATNPRVGVIVESKRSGKAAAINLFLRSTCEPIVVMVGGDVVFMPGSLARLLEPFTNPSVGMTGCRPIPTNPRAGIVGNAVNLLWDLHHEVSLTRPKLGEAVAFRRVLTSIDDRTLVDEASMEKVIRDNGMTLRYVPEAVVRNHGPEKIGEFIAQRTRIYLGHLSLRKQTGYEVSSMRAGSALKATWRVWRRGRSLPHLLLTLGLEVTARTVAHARYLVQRPTDGVWRPIVTSKNVIGNGHVMRSHHDEIRTIRLTHTFGYPTTRKALATLRSLVRADDRISFKHGQLTITIDGDERASRLLLARLDAGKPEVRSPDDGAIPGPPGP